MFKNSLIHYFSVCKLGIQQNESVSKRIDSLNEMKRVIQHFTVVSEIRQLSDTKIHPLLLVLVLPFFSNALATAFFSRPVLTMAGSALA